ncbi:hypothetical protein BV20DRAFT_965847 [Pilatotrama ljubarskyi]|nr:hypothetical protein BV20DRAFT_965847 [Pilatotrama ljubarskyi]
MRVEVHSFMILSLSLSLLSSSLFAYAYAHTFVMRSSLLLRHRAFRVQYCVAMRHCFWARGAPPIMYP